MNIGEWNFGFNVVVQLGLCFFVYGMGLVIGDINCDQIFDFFVILLGEDVFWFGMFEGIFVDFIGFWNVGFVLGYLKCCFKWGVILIDMDNDGWEDLFVVVGGLLEFLELFGGI